MGRRKEADGGKGARPSLERAVRKGMEKGGGLEGRRPTSLSWGEDSKRGGSAEKTIVNIEEKGVFFLRRLHP